MRAWASLCRKQTALEDRMAECQGGAIHNVVMEFVWTLRDDPRAEAHAGNASRRRKVLTEIAGRSRS